MRLLYLAYLFDSRLGNNGLTTRATLKLRALAFLLLRVQPFQHILVDLQ